MASTTAMFSGLSGLSSNSRQLEVIGNNIANVNTTAFKSNRLLFAPQLSRNFSLGSGPSGVSGGSNPGQIGLGVSVGATQRDFGTGGISTTGIPSDLAIEGDGFFVVEAAGDRMFTRDGAFQFNAANDLVTSTGARVLGYPVDDEFQIVEGELTNLSIPLGVQTLAEQTRNVEFSGNLNADGDLPTSAAVFGFGRLEDAATADITPASLMTAIDVAGPVFAPGDTITLSGAERGGKVVPDATFTIGATTTVQDYLDFMVAALGVVPQGGFDATDPNQPAAEFGGASMAGGVITLTGNIGVMNDLTIEPGNLIVNSTSGTNPFAFSKTADATGESVRTTYTVYDSLGSPLNVDLTMALSRADSGGTYWRAFLHAADDTDLAIHLEEGDRSTGAFTDFVPLLQFDTVGRLVSNAPINVELDRLDTGSVDPMNFGLQFNTDGSQVTAFAHPDGAEGPSTLAATRQDGSPLGVLSSFAVGVDGVITGGFSNGLTRTVGQVAVAKFTNAEGLVDAGNNLFATGPNSGTPLITAPLEFGTGRILGGSLELSNVDLSQEFTNMILTSTGYSASSRVITTSDQLLQELLLLAR